MKIKRGKVMEQNILSRVKKSTAAILTGVAAIELSKYSSGDLVANFCFVAGSASLLYGHFQSHVAYTEEAYIKADVGLQKDVDRIVEEFYERIQKANDIQIL